MILFEEIVPTTKQVQILYKLLQARRHMISHQKLPDFAAHQTFVETHPYRCWLLVKDDDRYIGSCYLSPQNQIGINVGDDYLEQAVPEIIRCFTSQFTPRIGKKSVYPDYFCINVPVTNSRLMDVLKQQGHQALQLTFKL